MMNRTVLVGRLTKDPELKYTPNGVAVATFTLAVNRNFTNQQGERDADFINIFVWRKPAENAANFLKKGSLAGIDGRIQTRYYEGQDGKRVYVTEVHAESVQFLEPKNNGQEQPASRNNNNSNNGNNNYNNGNDNRNTNNSRNGNSRNQGRSNMPYDDDPFANGSQIDITDDDLPF